MYGRPTKYNKKLLHKLIKIIEDFKKTPMVTRKNINPPDAKEPFYVTEYGTLTIWGVCAKLGISEDIANKWADPDSIYYKPRFFGLWSMLKELIKDRIAELALRRYTAERTSSLILGNLKVIDHNKGTQIVNDNSDKSINLTFDVHTSAIDKAHNSLKSKVNDVFEAVLVEKQTEKPLVSGDIEVPVQKAPPVVEDLRKKLESVISNENRT